MPRKPVFIRASKKMSRPASRTARVGNQSILLNASERQRQRIALLNSRGLSGRVRTQKRGGRTNVRVRLSKGERKSIRTALNKSRNKPIPGLPRVKQPERSQRIEIDQRQEIKRTNQAAKARRKEQLTFSYTQLELLDLCKQRLSENDSPIKTNRAFTAARGELQSLGYLNRAAKANLIDQILELEFE